MVLQGGKDFTLVDTKLGKREIGLQQIEYLYYIVCWLWREYRFRHFGIHSSACSDKHVAIYEFEQMPQQGRSVDVHALAETLRQIFYIKVMMFFGKTQYG